MERKFFALHKLPESARISGIVSNFLLI